MTSPSPSSETIDRLTNGAYSSFAMQAGMQLDVFTPLKDGPMTTDQVADALGVGGLLTVEGEFFSNTPEVNLYLVRGEPSYLGGRHRDLASQWGPLFFLAR